MNHWERRHPAGEMPHKQKDAGKDAGAPRTPFMVPVHPPKRKEALRYVPFASVHLQEGTFFSSEKFGVRRVSSLN